MNNEIQLRRALAKLAGSEPHLPAVDVVVGSAITTPRRRGAHVALGLAAVLALVAATMPLWRAGKETDVLARGSSPGVSAVPKPDWSTCPADTDYQVFATLSDEREVVEHGGSDILPEFGSTTLKRVSDAKRRGEESLKRGYALAVRVSVGPGLGWTYEPAEGGDRVTYHHSSDYQIYLEFPAQVACPDTISIFLQDGDQRIPVRYVFPRVG